MSLTKRIKGNFTIETVEYGDSIILIPAEQDPANKGEVVIEGDLTVRGNTTTIESTETAIVDNTIVLNSGETGTGVGPDGTGKSGIEIDRGPVTDNAGIRFDDFADIWEVNNGTGSWIPIVTGSAIANVVEDTSPQLGGNLDVNGWTITSTNASDGTSGANGADIIIAVDPTGLVKFEQELTLKEQTTPALEAGYSKIYASAPVDGGSGLHYVNDAGTDDELVSKKKAITYGLIF